MNDFTGVNQGGKGKWRRVLEVAREEALNYQKQYGIPPILREVFYRLVGRGVIPNTQSAYKTLSAVVAEARYFGEFPWSLIRDESRGIRQVSMTTLVDAERVVSELNNLTEEKKRQLLIEYLREKYRVNVWKWANQRQVPIVVVEKQSLLDSIDRVVNGDLQWQVFTTSTRGFESATAIHEVVQLIKRLRRNNVTVVLLLLFDFDPSGEFATVDFVFRVLALLDDARALFREWARLGSLREKIELVKGLADKHGVKYEKVMLTYEQVKKYNLPPIPSQREVVEKLQRDTRRKHFEGEYGFLGQVELEAMTGQYHDEVVKILNEAISRYFDVEVYEEVRRREEELRKRAQELLR